MKLFKEVLKKYKFMITLYILIGIIINFLNIYEIKLFQRIIDSFESNLSISIIIVYGLVLLINLIIGYFENYPEQQLKNGLPLSFKLQALKKMQTIDYYEYSKIGTGVLTERVNEGSENASNILMNYYFKLFRQLIPTVFFSLFYIAGIDLKLLLIVITGYVFVMIITKILLKKLYTVKEKILINQEILSKHFIRGFMELVIFRTNKKYGTEIKIIENRINNIVNGKTRIELIHELFFTLFAIIVAFIKISLLVYSFYTRNLTIGEIVAVITLLGKIYEPIAIFNVEYIDYKLNMKAVERYIKLLNIKDTPNINKGEVLKNVDGKIVFENVKYYYSKKKVINDISFELEKNTISAFVGETGSGKTTIIKLISGLLSTKTGKVLIDNKNINEINLNSYYDYLSYVSQDSVIFDGTLKENLIFDKNVSKEKIENVLKLVCLDKFYNKLPEKLDTKLGEKGILISGGERQRIALARLFFDDSKIIVLDEATSALDNITEKKIMSNIKKELKNKTIVMVAHRLETIENVDKIFVIKNGELKSQGNYKYLSKNDDYFKELIKKDLEEKN